jgi:hypothetical protein
MMNTLLENNKRPTSDINKTVEQYKDKIVILKDCESVDCMTVYEMARWLSLMEAISVVDKKCDQLKQPRDDNTWIKPLAFQKFVDERTTSLIFEIINDIQAGNLEVY